MTTPDLYFCAGSDCPGLTWRASDRAHPASCVGQDVSCNDSAIDQRTLWHERDQRISKAADLLAAFIGDVYVAGAVSWDTRSSAANALTTLLVAARERACARPEHLP